MPDISEKLGLSLPLSNETFSRESYRQNLLEIDEKTAHQTQVDEPFFLKSAIYNTGQNSIDLTYGKGRANFNGSLVNKTGDSSYTISSPTINTDYYIYLNNDGTYTHNTNGVGISGAVLIWKVGTGATLGHLTLNDQRDQLPGASAKAVYDSLNQGLTNLAGAGRTTETVKGNADALTSHLVDSSSAHGINNVWYTVNSHYTDYAAHGYDGKSQDITWGSNSRPTQIKHFSGPNKTGNLIKQVDFIWTNGKPSQETITLKDYDFSNQLINTTTQTITYIWVNDRLSEVSVV